MEFGKTYLYKLHALTNALDKAFDQTLRNHTPVGLSQFSLLAAISQEGSVNQRQLAHFLEVSTPAVSRQVDIARRMGWLKVAASPTDRHGHLLTLTPEGQQLVDQGMEALETHLFKIFSAHNRPTNLMQHINYLHKEAKGVISEQTAQKTRHVALKKVKERI